jgi:nitrite reductase/ring-hydroxylating ferredoxin subunit/DMSO/TMAO reductase YedYZ heme-binding membrane subunit
MSVGFKAVQWNNRKLVYDAIVLAAALTFIVLFVVIKSRLSPPNNNLDWIDLRINACGVCAFTMLTIILSIGPLARLDARFLPLLYNRRHFGVIMFLVALAHASFVVEWFMARGALHELWAEYTDWPSYFKFIGFSMKVPGLAALTILLLLAATSHDFWLAFLTPRVWKGLHMLLYVAYAILVMHVALGVMQDDRRPLIPILVGGAFGAVTLLHVLAAWRERQTDRAETHGQWIAVGPPGSIPNQRARIITAPGGERIAVFRDGNQIGALTNACAHQNGPLGEGCILNGLVTCPWHGYEYRLEDGCAPPPFTEKLATYRVRLRDGIIEVDPNALPPGTKAAITIA